MTTTTVPMAITCPDWCTESPEEHAEMLWQWGGESLHYADDVVVTDQTGLHPGGFRERTFCREIIVRLSATTAPEGRETADPLLMIDDHEISFDQAELLAKTLTDLVATHRAWQKEQGR